MDISLQQYCIALKQRNLYVGLMSGINSASQTKNREELNCTTPSTFAQLQMRRKAEILQYKNNSSTTNTGSKKQQYVKLAKNSSKNLKTISSRICPDNIYLCALSTSSDVPGPIIKLCYDPSVNLIQPVTIPSNKRKQEIPRDPLDREYNAFTNTNIEITVVDQPIANFVIVAPTSLSMNFSFTIPLAIFISVPVSFAVINSMITFIPQFIFHIYYGDNIVYTLANPVIQQPIIANVDVSNGTISATSYANTMSISNIVLQTFRQDVYTISMSLSNATIIEASGCTVDAGSSIIQWTANPTNINAVSTNCTITNVEPFSNFSYNIMN